MFASILNFFAELIGGTVFSIAWINDEVECPKSLIK